MKLTLSLVKQSAHPQQPQFTPHLAAPPKKNPTVSDATQTRISRNAPCRIPQKAWPGSPAHAQNVLTVPSGRSVNKKIRETCSNPLPCLRLSTNDGPSLFRHAAHPHRKHAQSGFGGAPTGRTGDGGGGLALGLPKLSVRRKAADLR